MFPFKLPDIGEGIQEGEIVRWMKEEGDDVAEDEPFVEVMTDKATVELTSPRAGKIGKLHYNEGDVAEVGEVIAEIEESGGGEKKGDEKDTDGEEAEDEGDEKASSEDASVEMKDKDADEAEEEEKEEDKTLFELPKGGAGATKKIQRRQQRGGGGGAAVPQVPEGYKAKAAPAVRKYAREQDVDIHQVPGTGPDDRVVRADIDRFLEAQEGGAPQGAPAGMGFDYSDVKYSLDPEREERIPVKGLRRTIAKAMSRSKYTATHFTYVAEVDCDKLVEMRERAKKTAEERGVKLTYLPFVVKAAVAALKQYPEVNAAFDEVNEEIVQKDYFHIGIATATDAGLIVPVVKDADQKGMLEVAEEIADLSERTRNMKAKPDELQGSTFTITSLGKLGGVMATPIINYPEVAIMGIHELKQVPVVKDGELAIGWRMNVSFSFDHRIIDGYNGAQFANTLVKYLEDPELLLLESF